jgi:hypothetical protein
MASISVGELKELLEDYGDHVPVILVINRGEEDVRYEEFDIDTQTLSDGVVVTLTADD